MLRRALSVATVVLCLTLPTTGARAEEPVPLRNWQAPPFWASGAGGATPEASRESGQPIEDPEALPTPPLAFVAIAPCRLADTRDAGFPGPLGPPPLSAGVPRDFPVTGGCGIPAQAQAVSFNVTVTNTLGAGFILAYPTGGAAPTVSTVNYVAAQTIANAAVVPLGTDGKATFVAGVAGTDLILDVNGYYAPQTVVNTLNGLSGAVTVAPGQDITLTPAGQTVILAANSTAANSPSTLVRRDGAGSFAAGTITANLTGAASANVLKSGDTMTGSLTVSSGNLNLAGRIVMNGDSGAAGEVLTSAGAGSPPTWSSGALSGLGRFACTINNNTAQAGLMSFTTSGNLSTQSGPLDLLSLLYNTGSDFTIDTAANTITVNRTGLYHFEGMIRYFVTTSSTSVTSLARGALKMDVDPVSGITQSLILDEERMTLMDNVGTNKYNLSIKFSVDRHIVQGSVVTFTTDINNLDVPLSLAALGVSSGGHFSGYLIAE